jgi:hypothetical protein
VSLKCDHALGYTKHPQTALCVAVSEKDVKKEYDSFKITYSVVITELLKAVTLLTLS